MDSIEKYLDIQIQRRIENKEKILFDILSKRTIKSNRLKTTN
jgi:hypothetical protein